MSTLQVEPFPECRDVIACQKDTAVFALQRGVQCVYPIKDIRKIALHFNPVHVLHVPHQWGVDICEEEKDFLTQITQAGEDFAPGQPPDLVLQEQLMEVGAHLIAEDGEETSDLIRFTMFTASARTARRSLTSSWLPRPANG